LSSVGVELEAPRLVVERLAAARRPGSSSKIDVRHRNAVRVFDDEAGVPVDLREGGTPVLSGIYFLGAY
jgi:hypothetical protein